jgi:hypothetical protein
MQLAHNGLQREPKAQRPKSLEKPKQDKPASLSATLLAIQENRGTLYMLDVSRVLIERWDLNCDHLHAQSSETRELVASLLKV